jgi:hypothetical protein
MSANGHVVRSTFIIVAILGLSSFVELPEALAQGNSGAGVGSTPSFGPKELRPSSAQPKKAQQPVPGQIKPGPVENLAVGTQVSSQPNEPKASSDQSEKGKQPQLKPEIKGRTKKKDGP